MTLRLRMFAGPNGSGKSTIKINVEKKHPGIFGVYVNPDEVSREILDSGRLRFAQFKIKTSEEEFLTYLRASVVLAKQGAAPEVENLRVSRNTARFTARAREAASVFSSPICDFLHEKLIAARKSFTLETVMSHKHKIALLRNAQQNGYRTYLYYVATEDPEINLDRVKIRVSQGGHDVAPERVVERYRRSLDNLLDAIEASDRAYIFDNSDDDSYLFAEITDGTDLYPKEREVPIWFKKNVLDKLGIELSAKGT